MQLVKVRLYHRVSLTCHLPKWGPAEYNEKAKVPGDT